MERDLKGCSQKSILDTIPGLGRAKENNKTSFESRFGTAGS